VAVEPWRGRWNVFGAETFWLNLVNVAFGVGTVAAIGTVVVAIVREIASHGAHHSRKSPAAVHAPSVECRTS
jgi:hypothetical protein